jgi:hypothetical protein
VRLTCSYSYASGQSIQNYEFNPPSFPDWLWTRPLMDRLHRYLRISGKTTVDVVALARSRLLSTCCRMRDSPVWSFVPRSHSEFLFDFMRPLLYSHIEADTQGLWSRDWWQWHRRTRFLIRTVGRRFRHKFLPESCFKRDTIVSKRPDIG